MKYLITISKSQVKDYVSTSTIKQVIAGLHYDAGIECIYGKWERHGVYKQLHFHGIFYVPSHTQYYKYTKLCGMHLHFQKLIYHHVTWDYLQKKIKKYIDKHYNPWHNTQQDTALANYFKHHYIFNKEHYLLI